MRGVARLREQVDADDVVDRQLRQQLADHAVAGAEVQRRQPAGLESGRFQLRPEQLRDHAWRVALQLLGEQPFVEAWDLVDLRVIMEADAAFPSDLDLAPF